MTRAHSRISLKVNPPYLELATIHQTCLDALQSVDLLPRRPEPIRIDRLIEKKFGIEPQYEDLPNGVLGYTKFADGIPTAVIVNKSLDRFDGSVDARRLRTTFAHEAGHCLLHAGLFSRKRFGPSLFPEQDGPSKPPFLCRHQNHRNGHKTKRPLSRFGRLEFQANRAMGALLLPKPLVEQVLEPFTDTNELGVAMVDSSRFEDVVRTLSRVFDVNPVVARICLEDDFGICP